MRAARRPHDGVLVVRPQGALDTDAVDVVIDLLDRSEGPAIVDLDECIVVDPVVAERLAMLSALRAPDLVCAVCHRLSARRLLARSSAMRDVMMFRSVEEAVQALVLAKHGFGSGWGAA